MNTSNLTKYCNEALILAAISEGKKHGYELALDIERNSGGYFTFNYGTLYPILHKLEKSGLITGNWKNEGPKRKRKYYTLSSKGKKYYQSHIKEWKEFFNHFSKIIGDELK